MLNLSGKCSRYENPKQYRERIISHYIAYFSQFISFISFSTIQISLWTYLHKLVPNSDKTFYGYILGVEALGLTLYSTIIGFLCKKLQSTRILFVTNLLFEVLSILIHVSLENIGSDQRKYWMLLSRFLGGLASVNMVLSGIHVTLSTLVSERRSKLSNTGIILGLGLAFSAIIQLMTIHFGDTGFWLIPEVLMINMYTSTQWFLIALCLFNIMLFHPAIFKEYSLIEKDDDIEPQHQQFKVKNYKFVAVVLIIMYFAATVQHTFLLIMGSPLVMDIFAADRTTALSLCSYLNLGSAAITIIVATTIEKLCKLSSERKVLAAYMFLVILGRLMFYPVSSEHVKTYDYEAYLSNTTGDYRGCPSNQNWCINERQLSLSQYIIGTMVETAGYVAEIVLLLSIFSKILVQGKQAHWMGVYGSAGGVSRFVSPIIISHLYTFYGPATTTVITVCEFSFFVILFLLCLKYLITPDKAEDQEIPVHLKDKLLEGFNMNRLEFLGQLH